MSLQKEDEKDEVDGNQDKPKVPKMTKLLSKLKQIGADMKAGNVVCLITVCTDVMYALIECNVCIKCEHCGDVIKRILYFVLFMK